MKQTEVKVYKFDLYDIYKSKILKKLDQQEKHASFCNSLQFTQNVLIILREYCF